MIHFSFSAQALGVGHGHFDMGTRQSNIDDEGSDRLPKDIIDVLYKGSLEEIYSMTLGPIGSYMWWDESRETGKTTYGCVLGMDGCCYRVS